MCGAPVIRALRSRDQPPCRPPGFSFLSSCRASHQQLPGTQVSSRLSPHSPAHLVRALVCLFHPQPPVPAPPHGHTCPQASPLCWVVVSSGPSDSSIWKPRASPVTLSPAALARRPRHMSQSASSTHPASSPPSSMKPRPRDDLPKQSQNPPSPQPRLHQPDENHRPLSRWPLQLPPVGPPAPTPIPL